MESRNRIGAQQCREQPTTREKEAPCQYPLCICPAFQRNTEEKTGNFLRDGFGNSAVRSREYLTPDEVEGLIKSAKNVGRHGHRDTTLILLAYRHGFRVSELIALRWDQIDLKQGLLHVNRLKNGTPSNHPIRGPEIRALRRLQREYPELTPYVFVTSAKDRSPRQRSARSSPGLVGRRNSPSPSIHTCCGMLDGYKLANDGHDTRAIQHYLGHKNITHTVRYTELKSSSIASTAFGRIECPLP